MGVCLLVPSVKKAIPLVHSDSVHISGNRVHFAVSQPTPPELYVNYRVKPPNSRRGGKLNFTLHQWAAWWARVLHDYLRRLWITRRAYGDLPVDICRRRSDKEIMAVLALKSRVIAGGSFSIGTSRSDRVFEIKTREERALDGLAYARTGPGVHDRMIHDLTTSEAGRRSPQLALICCRLLSANN